jgi:uncharacterized membrane protein
VATVSESVLIHASAAEAWDYYFDPRGWPAWVDGFAMVESEAGYPQQGGTLVWRSTPAGRGTVTEKVVAHEPRRLHRISFADPESAGELTTTFAIEGEATRVGLELDYRLAAGGPLAWITDRLFVRSQVVKSLQRSLARLRLETEEVADAARQASAAPAPGDR